jgi:hypothetical protein
MAQDQDIDAAIKAHEDMLIDQQIREAEGMLANGVYTHPANTPAIGGFLKGVGRTADYLGGMARAGIANDVQPIVKAVTGKDLTSPEEQLKGLKMSDHFPSSDEYMKRLGIPEGGHLSDLVPGLYSETGDELLKLKKHGILDPTPRGTVGLAADIATDPLTYLGPALKSLKAARPAGELAGLGEKALEVADKAANPIANTLENGGEALYKSGFKKIDRRAIERGQEPVSDFAFQQDMWGGNKSLYEQMQKRLKDLKSARDSAYKLGDVRNAVVDQDIAEQGARSFLTELSQQGYGKAERAEKLLETLNKRPVADRPGGLSLQQASDIKTSLYDALPEAAFDVNGRLTNDGKVMLQKLSEGYRKDIVEAANTAQAGLGDTINDFNREMGAYLNADKPTRAEIAKDSGKNLITQVKAGVAAANPKVAATMYGAQALNSPRFRTGAGLLLDKLGDLPLIRDAVETGLVDPVARRMEIDSSRPKLGNYDLRSPQSAGQWELMLRQQKDKKEKSK